MSKIWSAAVTGVVGVASLLMAGESWAQTKELKFANFITTTTLTHNVLLKPWMDRINEQLGTGYQIRGYWGGTLGRDPSQYSKLVRDGVADLAMVTFGGTSSFPDSTVLELPFLTRSSLEGSLLHWRLHKKMALAGYDDFHWLALWALPPYQFHFARPIRNFDSLANLKVRSGGNISTQIIEKLGMTPVSGPVNSAAESLSRQTWDGIFIEWSAGDTFGVHKVAKYHYELDIASIGLGVAMNKKAYESLDAAARKAFDDQSGEALTSGFGKMSDEDRLNVIKRVSEDKDQVIIKPTAAELEKARKAVAPITEEWLKSSPRNPPIYEATNQILSDIRK